MSENEAGQQAFPSYVMRSDKRSRLLIFIAGFFILLAIILTGLFILGSMQKKQAAVAPVPTVAATTTPLPTSSVSAVLTVGLTGSITPIISLRPTSQGNSRSPVAPTGGISTVDRTTNLDRAKLSVAILNGSGITGAAAGVSIYLKGLGYNIVKVENADVFTYKNLTVKVKKSKSSYAGLLRSDLQANPEFATSNASIASVSASVSDTIEVDAEVIVGK